MEAIIQLRDTKFDSALVGLVRGLLVPTVQAVTYYTHICRSFAGARWSPLIERSLEEDVAIAKEFGSNLAKYRIAMNSDAVVESYIIPRLKNVLENDMPHPLLHILILKV